MNLQVLIKSFPDPVIVVSRGGQVFEFNEAARGLFNRLEAGKPLSHAVRNSELLETVAASFAKKKKTGVSFMLKKPLRRSMSATVIFLENGDTGTGEDVVFIHMRDMSEQERLAKMRMHFIANASHELRTPLASMSGFIETLQTTARDDEPARERFLEIMAGQARRMTRLISDLLSLSRLEMNAEPPPDVAVDLADTVTGVIDALRPLAAENGVSLEMSGFGKPVFVRGDRDELVQVFQNIIHNAIRYGGDGGEVQIQLLRIAPGKRHAARIALSVTDFGVGIARKHIPRLTERFYRVDKVISRNKGGTGLGLAIARHIIMRHHGKLEITSKPGKGSTFRVILPQE